VIASTTTVDERQALEDMVQSHGWAIFQAHVAKVWGPEAFESAVARALAECPPDEERALTSRIHDTFKGVRATLKWPEEQLKALKAGADRQKAVAADPFALFRRGPKTK
jgi:DNA-binding transcriptional regulator GbsR (MarR family)